MTATEILESIRNKNKTLYDTYVRLLLYFERNSRAVATLDLSTGSTVDADYYHELSKVDLDDLPPEEADRIRENLAGMREDSGGTKRADAITNNLNAFAQKMPEIQERLDKMRDRLGTEDSKKAEQTVQKIIQLDVTVEDFAYGDA